ncbi:MAG TPA: DUF1549 domain-containing protein, partial [Methylomirabilota bacterium]|nr:DUF1549 domain-containing protein [Methylomirabilota bacterium]
MGAIPMNGLAQPGRSRIRRQSCLWFSVLCARMCLLLTLGVPAAASDPSAQSPSAWWSFQPLTLPEVPPAQPSPTAWSEHPIDRFILAKLEANGLAPSPPADRRTLIRRVTYDLTGLPPTPGEISDFVKDSRNDAYERVVDRLLASPRYGEQWGRHWLDAIRFGESRGFERNEIINTAWPFRDYVIRSFNEDKPFNQLVLEHLAGDVIGAGNPDVAIGSAFLVAGPYDDVGNQDPVQARVIRANTVDEIITAVGSAFLGITVHCARCHDHKFDPVTAEDYYRFQSVFSGVRHGERALESPEERRAREARLAPLESRRAVALEALESFEAGVLERAPAGDDAEPEYHLTPVHPHLTEDVFEPVEAKKIRLSIRSNNRDPRDAGGVRIDEFEVWAEGDTPRNVALADAGAVATGPSRQAEDFADAYAVSLVNDGRYGARWIVDGPAEMVVTFPEIERVRRVAFSADRTKALPPDSGEIVFVGEYRIEVSVDGTNWTRVADSTERPPLNEQFARERRLTAALTPEDLQERARLHGELLAIEAEIRKVPPARMVWAGGFEQPGAAAYVMLGGDPERKGAEVGAGSLSALDGVVEGFQLPKDAPESERRVALAKWLVKPDNPL